MDMLPGFGISGYRSFGSNSPQLLHPLAKVNLIAGQNNAGKSNVLRFIEFVSRGTHGGSPEAKLGALDVPRVGGSAPALLHLPSLSADHDWRSRAAGSRQQRTVDAVISLLQSASPGSDIWIPLQIKRPSRRGAELAEGWIDQVVGQGSIPLENLRAVVGLVASSYTVSSVGMLGPLIAGLALPPIPPVVTIPAFRRLAENPGGNDSVPWHDGRGLIDALRHLQNPTAEKQQDLAKWEQIQHFVRTILGDSGVSLAIPAQEHTINVRRGTDLLPLENQGTGVHEVVVLAAAATLLEDHLVCIEEPEVHLHPLLQRQLVRYLNEFTSNQYLIATHSAHLIDTDIAAVFHVTLTDNGSTITAVQDAGSRSTLVADLGYRASDLVQANAVIWVEGPSDRVYVRHWLQLADSSLIEGLHYSIMFYGGRLLNHLSPNDDDVEDFISLRRMNRHVAVLIDSDKAGPRKRLNQTKRRVKDALSQKEGMAWVTARYTIENYVPHDLLADAVTTAHPAAQVTVADRWTNPLGEACITSNSPRGGAVRVDKLRVAHLVAQAWTETSGRPHDLDERVSELLAFVHEANGLSAAPETQ